MLELKNIKKDYALKDQEPVHALKGISLKFRKEEFVAILGPSGCGKTTLLNIIGGLDHYDEGDLIIKGKSTKDFIDKDWDTYRNHSIGFVFQSYNLIPHQSILKNVELALTISGVKKEERVARAKEALDRVGLEGLYKKRPNQLSGGQMQRVAIARALVNNPEIVLADEPTGALDSETSVQIMDILKEVSKSHLVIMVTHNPDLADKYASRIVNMKDGLITHDSNPYNEVYLAKEEIVENKGKKQSSMSFVTATTLSLSNLFSKLKRTLLVAIAGSIGIIGVSTVLAVTTGVNNFIADMQEDMLSRYPISVDETTLDTSSLLSGFTDSDRKEAQKFDITTQVGMDSMIEYLMGKYTDFTNLKSNDITEDLIKYVDEMPSNYYSSMSKLYGLDVTNNFFTTFKEKKNNPKTDIISLNGLTQRYISTLKTVDGFSDYARFVNIFTGFMNQLPEEKDYILSQYDFVGEKSHFPSNENEILLVVDDDTTLTDLILAQMGFYPQDEFLNIAKKAVMVDKAHKAYISGEINKQEYERRIAIYNQKFKYDSVFNIDDILNHEMYYFPHDAIYEKNPTFVSHNQGTMSLVAPGTYMGSPVTIIGNFEYKNKDDSLGCTLVILNNDNTLNTTYTISLYRDPLTPREKDGSVFDGHWNFSLNYSGVLLDVNMTIDSSLASSTSKEYVYDVIGNGSIIAQGMKVLDIPAIDNKKAIKETTPATPDYYYEAYLRNTDPAVNIDKSDYYNNPESKGGSKVKIAGILRAKKSVNFGCLSRGVYYTAGFGRKYITQAASSQIVSAFEKHLKDSYSLKTNAASASTFNAYTHYWYNSYIDDPTDPDNPEPEEYDPPLVEGYSTAFNNPGGALSSIFLSFMTNESALDTDSSALRVLSGIKVVITEKNILQNNVEFKTVPNSIYVYPKNFVTKDYVKSYLKVWNSDKDIQLKSGQVIKASSREEITISDTISLIIALISTMVDAISIALIAFTSLSLVVSCFMIAVITYISVMERVKEIGVIRSLGGRKKDVSRLFIAENLITGFSSGVIGIVFTYILQIIINVIATPYGVSNIAALPFYLALAMIGVSILLSVVSGLIPSFSASKQDPVIALRTE